MSGNVCIEAAAATAQWKREHHRKIEEKFQQPPQRNRGCNGSLTTSEDSNDGPRIEILNTQQFEPPLTIDNYDDVQPMWKGMESRVTKRTALTLEQRGGVSGRRNVRKSEEDMWLESGLYDSKKCDK